MHRHQLACQNSTSTLKSYIDLGLNMRCARLVQKHTIANVAGFMLAFCLCAIPATCCMADRGNLLLLSRDLTVHSGKDKLFDLHSNPRGCKGSLRHLRDGQDAADGAGSPFPGVDARRTLQQPLHLPCHARRCLVRLPLARRVLKRLCLRARHTTSKFKESLSGSIQDEKSIKRMTSKGSPSLGKMYK